MNTYHVTVALTWPAKPPAHVKSHTPVQHEQHTITHNHTHTQRVEILAEEFDEAALAVGFVVLLFEGSLVQLLQAEGADEMLGMELLAHGWDAAARDGFLTAGTQRPPAGVIMNLTVRLPVVLEETAVYEGCETLLQHTHQITWHSKHCYNIIRIQC